ncbi:hypothetical protein PVAR5_0784 [Paecilomyces variotii No. 5]|uniref:Uncharacterized protein n=1 Tax=Byssochlamys spectabilis (strain No. 5 / NBRC 109023) TaxID=1356009 RepID=V5HS19_BYSSN|nr:hypothetical protein PVAR5_0784 [Paecilomyces variotii No. 5]
MYPIQRYYSRLSPQLTRSRSEKALDSIRVPSTTTDKEGRILPDSLEKTLRIHRASNRASLFRKVAYNKPSPDVFRPTLSKRSPGEKQGGLKEETQQPFNVEDAADGKKSSELMQKAQKDLLSGLKASAETRIGDSGQNESIRDGHSQKAG